jgi:hypothetical protein
MPHEYRKKTMAMIGFLIRSISMSNSKLFHGCQDMKKVIPEPGTHGRSPGEENVVYIKGFIKG